MTTNLAQSPEFLAAQISRDLIDENRFEEVAAFLKKALVQYPSDPILLSNMGKALLGLAPREGGLNVLLQALSYFEKAGEFGLKNEKFTYNRGVCHERIADEYSAESPEKANHLSTALRLFKALAFKLATQL